MNWRLCRECDDDRHAVREIRGMRYYRCPKRGTVVLDFRADPREQPMALREFIEVLERIEEAYCDDE